MDTKRPAVVRIAAILLLVLGLFVAGLGLGRQFGLFGRGFGNRQFTPGQFGNRNFAPPNGLPNNGFPNNGFQNSGTPNDQNNQGTTPNFTPNRTFGTTGFARIFRLLRPVTISLNIILLILAGVAAFGLFKGMRWGAVLAIVLAVLVFLLAIPGFIRVFSVVSVLENVFRMLLAAAVVVLLLLSTARRSYLPAREENDSEL